MESGINWESSDAALAEWRRKAANAVISVSLILHLPLLILVLSDYLMVSTILFKAMVIGIYAAVTAIALNRHLSHRLRVWLLLAAIQLLAFVTILGYPHGPVARALPIVVPVLAISLIGIEAGRIAAAISALVQMCAPLLRLTPGFSPALVRDALPEAVGTGFLWFQSMALTIEMVVVVILLERFYRFLLNALNEQRRTSELLNNENKTRRHLEREIARITDEERRHLGSEVHDGICQQLTGALLRCQALESRLERGAALSSADLASLSTLLGDTIDEARGVAQGLCPLDPTPEALAPALRALVKRTQSLSEAFCEFRTLGDVRIRDLNTAQHIYRIAQEALSNAVRHAHADRITVELSGRDADLVLKVEDNGAGLPAEAAGGGLGLRTMACRAQIIGGQLGIEAAPEGGTRILCRVPRSEVRLSDKMLGMSTGGNPL